MTLKLITLTRVSAHLHPHPLLEDSFKTHTHTKPVDVRLAEKAIHVNVLCCAVPVR